MKEHEFYNLSLEKEPTTKKTTAANSEKLQKFVCEFEYEGVMCTFVVYANNTIDAARRLGSIVSNATVRGPA